MRNIRVAQPTRSDVERHRTAGRRRVGSTAAAGLFFAAIVAALILPTITVTASPTTYASDAFARNIPAGWARADVGGDYALLGNLVDFSVSSQRGSIVLHGPGVTRAATLSTVRAQDVDLGFTFATDKAPTANGIYVYGVAREVAIGTEYRAKVRLAATGAIYVQVNRVVGSVETGLAGESRVSGAISDANARLQLRFQAIGSNPTTLRVKVWPAGQAEPATWAYETTDATPELQAAGAVGVRTYLSSTATNAPVTVSFDDLTATPAVSDSGPVVVTPAPTPAATPTATPARGGKGAPAPTPTVAPSATSPAGTPIATRAPVGKGAPAPTPTVAPSATSPAGTPAPGGTVAPTSVPVPTPTPTPVPTPTPTPVPTPTPTPVPTPTPTPVPTPTPTPVPTPTPTPVPTPTPTPVPTPTPTPVPTPTPTPVPTPTPTPVPTPTPTPVPTPTPTPVPTPTPTPVPTPTPTPVPTPTPTPVPTPTPSTDPNTLVVATWGSDQNAGTASSPWRTIQKAVDNAHFGSTILVHAGDYSPFVVTRSGMAGAPILIQGASGEAKPRVLANGATEVIRLSAVHDVTITGFEVTGAAGGNFSGDGIRVENASYNIVISNNNVHDNRTWGIQVHNSTEVTVSNNDVSHNEVGIQVSKAGEGVVITNNQVHDQDKMIVNTPTPGDDSGAVGIVFQKSTGNVLAANNTLWANRAASMDYTWDGGAFEIYGASNVTISGNQTWDNENILETGTDSSVACNNNTFTRNVSWGNASIGRSLGIILRCAQNMLVANNTFVNLDWWVFAIGTSSGYSGSLDNLTIVNNISSMAAGKVYGFETAVSSTVVINHNLDSVAAGAYIASYPGKGNASTLATFTSWTGFEANAIVGDPAFVAPGSHDYRIGLGSAAIDRGIMIPGVTDSYAGSAPDIGRYER